MTMTLQNFVDALCVQAVFEGGDYCHKHPARSLRVKLECGGEERAWDASEPSTCAYVVHASTPAACRAERLKELQVCASWGSVVVTIRLAASRHFAVAQAGTGQYTGVAAKSLGGSYVLCTLSAPCLHVLH